MAEERFDIYDEHLNPLGTATRSETHARGYWHRTFHCWLTRREGERQLVRFQRRQLGKDTNPGCWDITVAGHLAAGETLRDAVRELKEEIGVTARFEELIPLFRVREDASGIVNGKPFIDREVSDVFALVCDLPLDALRLQPEEVAGVYEAEVGELLALFRGETDELKASGVELESGNAAAVSGDRAESENATKVGGAGAGNGNRSEAGDAGAESGNATAAGGAVLESGNAAEAGDDSENATKTGGAATESGTGLSPFSPALSGGHYRLVPCIRTVRAEQFVPRDISYYTDMLLKLRELSPGEAES